MDHDDIRHKLSDYIDDEVSPQERLEIEQHLTSCETCSTALEELRRTLATVRQVEEAEPPAWMTAKIMARVREEAERKTGLLHRLFFPLASKLPVQAVALLFLAVTALYLSQNIRPEMKFAQEPAPELTAKQEAPSPGRRKGGAGEIPGKALQTAKPAPEQEQYAPQAPGYRSLDMKYSYEKPEEPELKDEGSRPAPSAAAPITREAEGTSRQATMMKSDATLPVIRIELAVANIGSALAALEKPLKDLPARVLLRDSRSVTLELDASKAPDLFRKLKEIGDPSPAREEIAPGTGTVKIIILLFEKG